MVRSFDENTGARVSVISISSQLNDLYVIARALEPVSPTPRTLPIEAAASSQAMSMPGRTEVQFGDQLPVREKLHFFGSDGKPV